MVTEGVVVPDDVIKHHGNVLDGTVMRGKRIEEEMVPENFENEERAPDKRIVAQEKTIVPHQLALQGWKADEKSDESEKRAADPLFGQVEAQRGKKTGERFRGWPNVRLIHGGRLKNQAEEGIAFFRSDLCNTIARREERAIRRRSHGHS
jgi:hypothetical protein